MTAGVALALLPALVAVAAAQPVVIHAKAFTERLDAQVFLVFDTSLSMKARSAPDAPTRLTRAKQEATALIPHLGDLPVGVATMTDRVLPNLMPTTTTALALTDDEAVGADRRAAARAFATTAARRRSRHLSRSSATGSSRRA